MNEKLYWTDYCQDKIEVFDPVTQYRRVLITTGTNPFAIIVDPGTGYVCRIYRYLCISSWLVFYRWLYWTDTGSRTIERASMDGSARAVLHNTNLHTPYALTIDYASQTLYWTDYALNRLESSRTDGSNRILLSTNLQDSYAMTFFTGKLYWTDLINNSIYSSQASSLSSITTTILINADPYAVHVIDESIQFEGMITTISDSLYDTSHHCSYKSLCN